MSKGAREWVAAGFLAVGTIAVLVYEATKAPAAALAAAILFATGGAFMKEGSGR